MYFIKAIIEFVFSLGLFINALLFIPQAIKIYREKTVTGISLITFLGFLLIQFAIVLHGIINHDYLLVCGYLISMLSCGTVVILIFIYRKQNPDGNINDLTLEEIIAQLPEHIYWKDKNCISIGCNTNNWRDFGLKSYSDFKGKNDYILFPKEQADHLRSIDNEVLTTGKSKLVEEPLMNKNGSQVLYLSHKVPLKNKKGQIVGILGVSVDITRAKQQTEDRLEMLENIIAMMPGTVYWMDKNGIYLGCNDNEALAIGLKSRKDIIGKRNIDIPGFLIPEALDPINDEVMREGKSILLEEPAILADGTKAIFLSNKQPLYNNRKEIIGMVGISFDITDRKEKERLVVENEVQKQLLYEQEKFKKIAEQLAHDIRSPLASMQIIAKSCTEIPEAERIALREATLTITDIANNLLNRYQNKESDSSTLEERKPILVSALLLQLLADKKYQYADVALKLDHDFSQNGYFAFVRIAPTSLKRAVSNLINNAVDAFSPEGGKVVLKLDATPEWVKIIIQDNGKGMSPELIDKIRQNIAITEGKPDGHGIGLTQVRETLTENQGELHIESEIGAGSTVTMLFPRCTSPAWIADEIKLSPANLVVILDDDSSIHGAWDAHLEAVLKQEATIKVKHFMRGDAVLSYISTLSKAEKERVFLLTDYELLKQDLNGLDVIAQSQAGRSVLVTSHYTDEAILKQAANYNTRILPKILASEVPIVLENKPRQVSENVDLVVVDDNYKFLQFIIEKYVKNKKVDYYQNPYEFLKIFHLYPKDTKICLDDELNVDIKGRAIAERLHELGYTRLYLISGKAFKPGELPFYLAAVEKSKIGGLV